jgi:hypothetical protein
MISGKLSMAKNVKNATKRGRPEVDSEAVTVRLSRDVLTALDETRAAQLFPPSRAEIVRAAVVEWLKTKGLLK